MVGHRRALSSVLTFSERWNRYDGLARRPTFLCSESGPDGEKRFPLSQLSLAEAKKSTL